MYIQWNRQQLKSNRQLGEVLCPHAEILRPWILYPTLLHRGKNGRTTSIWSPAPTIRECCVERGEGLALAAWWWEAKNRFEDLVRVGLEDKEAAKALLEQLDIVEEILEDRVPKPTQQEWDRYLEYRQDLGLTKRRIRTDKLTPNCIRQLGLSWPCTKQHLIERWKELALRVHPDHGGDPREFRKYFSAYQEARGLLERSA